MSDVSLSADAEKLLNLIHSGLKTTAMLAPSFPVDFTEYQIVSGLKKLGFDHIVDHSLAIATVNKMYEETLKKYPDKLFIAANCPSTVDLIRTKYPDLIQFLLPVFSPMACMAKICKKTWSGNLNIFIGPCFSKKQEAKNYPEVSLVLAYKELFEIFQNQQIDIQSFTDESVGVEGFEEEMLKVFPTSGGIKQTIKEGLLKDEEILIADGPEKLKELFDSLTNNKLNTGVRLLDVLFCSGGCINGPGVNNRGSVEEKKQKLLDYLAKKGVRPQCSMVETS